MGRTVLALVGLMLCLPGVGIGDIVEDFSTVPAQRGWVDHGDNFAWSGSGYVAGVNVKRHLENAFYVPLANTLTEDDSFSARFDIAYYGSLRTYQFVYVGFLNKDEWFANGTPDTNNVSNIVSSVLSQHGSGGAAYMKSRVTSLDDDTRDSGWTFVAPQGNMLSYELTYTPYAGANSAGRLALSAFSRGDYDGTPLASMSSDLNAGDEFSVNAFGIFTGHTTANASDGFIAYMDNVEVIPEPATTTLCLAGIGLFLSKRRRIHAS